jgi:hypothetical protein
VFGAADHGWGVCLALGLVVVGNTEGTWRCLATGMTDVVYLAWLLPGPNVGEGVWRWDCVMIIDVRLRTCLPFVIVVGP